MTRSAFPEVEFLYNPLPILNQIAEARNTRENFEICFEVYGKQRASLLDLLDEFAAFHQVTPELSARESTTYLREAHMFGTSCRELLQQIEEEGLGPDSPKEKEFLLLRSHFLASSLKAGICLEISLLPKWMVSRRRQLWARPTLEDVPTFQEMNDWTVEITAERVSVEEAVEILEASQWVVERCKEKIRKLEAEMALMEKIAALLTDKERDVGEISILPLIGMGVPDMRELLATVQGVERAGRAE